MLLINSGLFVVLALWACTLARTAWKQHQARLHLRARAAAAILMEATLGVQAARVRAHSDQMMQVAQDFVQEYSEQMANVVAQVDEQAAATLLKQAQTYKAQIEVRRLLERNRVAQ